MFKVELIKDLQLVTIFYDSVDATNAKKLKDFTKDVLADMQEPQSLVLDMQRVQFMDSSGLGVMVGILKLCGKETPLILSGLSQKVTDLFALTRMNKIFTIVEDVKSA